MSETDKDKDPAFSSDYLKLFIQFIEEKGLDSGKILNYIGIETTSLTKLSGHISFDQLFQLMKNFSSLIGIETWGLEFGARLQANTHGLLGNISISSQNSLQSLNAYRKYLELRGSVVSFDYQLTNKTILLSYNSLLEAGAAYRFAIDASMAATYTLIKSKLGCAPTVFGIRLSYPKPDNVRQYFDFYGAQPQFNSQENAIEFALEDFLKRNFSANKLLFNQAKNQSDEALTELRNNIYLPDLILNRLLLCRKRFPTLDETAIKLQINSRTLRRQLKKQNTSYQTVLSQAKQKIAAHYLIDTRISIDEIARLLGYSESANFTRAFKRWTGCSPMDFRNRKSLASS